MEQIIKMVTEKAGISDAQAKTAVETVLGFVKDKLPAGLGGQVDSIIKGNASSGITGGVTDKITGMFGK